jgi:hypothetical protein
MRDLILGGVSLLCGLWFLGWGVWRLRQPPRKDDLEWAQRHPFLNRLLGDSSPRRVPIHFDKAGAQSCVASGAFALVVGTALLVVG